MTNFIRQNIQQTLNVCSQLLNMLSSKPTSSVLDFTSQFSETLAGLKAKADGILEKFYEEHKNEEVEEMVFTD